jgi:hypothetical protein
VRGRRSFASATSSSPPPISRGSAKGSGGSATGLLLAVAVISAACGAQPGSAVASIEFTKVPPADKGGPDTLDTIAGRVVGARSGQRIVLFARSGVWWAEPGANRPLAIQPDSTWSSATHLGTEYAALLVGPEYVPPSTTDVLPKAGGAVFAVAVVPGDPLARPRHHSVEFSGYEWRVRAAPSGRGGHNVYDPANVWTDDNGALHLRIAGEPGRWTCAELSLLRHLGYGSYRFVVRDVSHLEPAAAFGIFTWDGPAAAQNHREMDIEISRWGDASSKNAQYVVQPYYVGGNVARFAAPAGVLTHLFRWEPGRATFKTIRGDGPGGKGPVVAEHVFLSGVPAPGDETLRMNLYLFQRSAQPLQNGAEVVVERFEYVP